VTDFEPSKINMWLEELVVMKVLAGGLRSSYMALAVATGAHELERVGSLTSAGEQIRGRWVKEGKDVQFLTEVYNKSFQLFVPAVLARKACAARL
jgi:hypothetical protein